jgi:RHS repeat-associated protein
VAQYVWGARPSHRDELVLRDRDTTGDGTLDERLYVLMDYFNPVAVVDTTGEVKERYAWSAFGLRSVLAPNWAPRAGSLFDWDFAFHGQFLDQETGYYNYGYRYYSPNLGRWLSRDPIEEEGGANLYASVGNNGVGKIDLLGEQVWTVANTWSEHITHVAGASGVGIAGHVRPSNWLVTWEIEEIDNGCYYELKVTDAKGSVVGNIGAPYKAAHELAHAADYKQSWSDLLEFAINVYDGHTASCRAEVECYGELVELYRKAALYRGIILGLSLHVTGRGTIPPEPAYVIAREAPVLRKYQSNYNSLSQEIQHKKNLCPQLCASGI